MTPPTKPLYVLIYDHGDGSYSTRYSMDSELMKKLEQAYDEGILNDGMTSIDGDGFHYDTINVPQSCTPESLGISFIKASDFDHIFRD